MASVGFINAVVFFILIAVVILCALNLSTYSDILQGNRLAPDISDGECITMIVINSIIIVASIIGGYFFIRKIYANAVDKFFTKDSSGNLVPILEKEEIAPEGVEHKSLRGKYVPNNSGTQITLWLVSSFIFVASILNLTNMTKLKNGDDANAAVPSSGVYLISWALFGVAGIYWVYTTLRTIMPRIPNYKIEFMEFFKAAAEKPVIPIVPCECDRGGIIKSLSQFKGMCKKDLKVIPENNIISTYPQNKTF